ncbi:retropepsin-like aspartic protease family protein [Prosthecomicrobium sp. N25]|uniref:retropepsin-like aspartic protease family protein n=1 Tax=Prosthecomicrobium sp. N25 TaxID=3129254 RepID=UPI003076B837
MVFGLILLGLGVALGLLMLNNDAGRVFGLESGDFSRLVILSAFALVIGAGVLRRFEGRFSEALRAGVLWLAIVAVLMTGYSYRTELEIAGRRMAGSLIPGLAVSTGEGGSVMVAKSRDGHFRVRAEANGQPIRLVVDTGASSVVLSDRDARDVGIDTSTLSYDVNVSTANGGTTAAPVVLESLSIGDITELRVHALVARPGQLEMSLLGNSFLDRLHSFTIQGDRLILRR